MGGIKAECTVNARNSFGRFIADVENAARETVTEASERGVSISKGMAPVGHKADPRSAPIKASFYRTTVSRTKAVWGNTARHALFQEFGTGPHVIMGSPWLGFFWDAMGRMWIPGLRGTPDFVNHPGHGPQPFLRPSYEAVAPTMLAIAAKFYPG